MTEEEIKSAIRKGGLGDIRSVSAVILETDGSFSVIANDAAGDHSAFPCRDTHE